LIAYLAAKGARLRESKVMRIGWLAPADQAGMAADEVQVLFIAMPTPATLMTSTHQRSAPAPW
jgi:hypothetical protein